jgi:Ala-tRNA(Pro) deacylase
MMASVLAMERLAQNMYDRLISMLDEHGARYRLIEHSAEGRTEIVSRMRGNELRAAAKCIILLVKLGRKQKQFVLAVVPGDKKISLAEIKSLYQATYVSFASTDIAERLAGSPTGTVLPFALNPELELIADPSLKQVEELYFNAARLDRSVAVKSEDYFSIAKPRIENISAHIEEEVQ